MHSPKSIFSLWSGWIVFVGFTFSTSSCVRLFLLYTSCEQSPKYTWSRGRPGCWQPGSCSSQGRALPEGPAFPAVPKAVQEYMYTSRGPRTAVARTHGRLIGRIVYIIAVKFWSIVYWPYFSCKYTRNS